MLNVKNTIFIFLLMFLVVGCATQEPVMEEDLNNEQQAEENLELPEVVASVNGDQITSDEVFMLSNEMQMYGMEPTLDELVEQLISQRLLMQTVNELDYQFTTDDVENYFVDMGVELDEIKTEVENQGLIYEEFLVDYIDELKFTQFLFEVQQNVEVTEEEMLEFYEDQKEFLDENLTYEDIQEEIYNFFLEQRSNEIITFLISERAEESDIQIYY